MQKPEKPAEHWGCWEAKHCPVERSLYATEVEHLGCGANTSLTWRWTETWWIVAGGLWVFQCHSKTIPATRGKYPAMIAWWHWTFLLLNSSCSDSTLTSQPLDYFNSCIRFHTGGSICGSLGLQNFLFMAEISLQIRVETLITVWLSGNSATGKECSTDLRQFL